jgi:hypothetical protein
VVVSSTLLPDEDFVRYLQPYLAQQSIDALSRDFGRWRRQMRAKGITRIPASPMVTDPNDVRASNLMCHFVQQKTPYGDSSVKHAVRNLTGFRPDKA